MSLRFAVVFEKAENHWAAYVPDLPGCITLAEFGDPLPEPASIAKVIDVSPACQY